jgi:hypothetical protein
MTMDGERNKKQGGGTEKKNRPGCPAPGTDPIQEPPEYKFKVN